MFAPKDFFDLDSYEHKEIFENCRFVWESLNNIREYIEKYSENHIKCDKFGQGVFADLSEYIYIGEGTVIEPGVYIKGPAVIGKNCVIRNGAYIRGNVIVGNGCTIGHTSEMKNAIMLDRAAVPHFNYCCDSIIGNGVNLGCGTVLSNLPFSSKKDPVTGKRNSVIIKYNEEVYDTGLAKFGAAIGDFSQTGCNCVLNPGTLLGKKVTVYPSVCVRKGYYRDCFIIK